MDKRSALRRIRTRINRGIVLGIVLAILLIGFVIADAVAFQSKTPKIRENLIAYITEIAELNMRMDSDKIGQRISNEDRTEIEAGLTEILNRYYADSSLAETITVYDGYDTGEIMEELSVWFDRTACMEVTEVRVFDTAEEFQISFERQGYHFARVRINDLPMEIDLCTGVNSPEPFLGGGPGYLIDPFYDHGSLGRRKTLKFFLSGNVYLTDIEGEWKILMSDFYTKTTTEEN